MRANIRSVLVLAAALLLWSGCASSVPNRAPLGESFPVVRADALDGKTVNVPKDFSGKPVVFAIGFIQDSQFDIDRWLLGLLQLETPVEVRELPAAAGISPRLFQNTIDQGMKGGIPSEDWGSVITLYGADADKIVAFTGNENLRNARIVLLDGQGVVRWFHDRGFSAAKGQELDAAVRALGPATAGNQPQ